MTRNPANLAASWRGLSGGDKVLAIGAIIAILVFLGASLSEPWGLALIPVVLVAGMAIYAVWRAIHGERTMILLVLVAAVFVVDAVFRVRAYEDKSIDFQVMLKAATWVVLAIYALGRAGIVLRTMLSGERVFWTAFLVWIAISASYAPNPLYANVASFSLVAFFAFFAAASAKFELEDVLAAVLAAIILLAIVSLIVYVAVPTLGRTRIWVGNVQVYSNRLSGIGGNANSIGRICCIGIIIAAIYWHPLKRFGRFYPAFATGLLSLTLLLSNSRTSILVLFVVLAMHFLFRKRNFHLFVVALCLMLVALLALAPFVEQIMIALSRSGRADELATGTSRTLIWHVVTMLGSQKPLAGWGYGSSVFIMPQYEYLMGHAAPHAHNIIMQLWLTTGMIGVALFLLALTTRFLASIVRGERAIIALLLFVILNGLTESSAFSGIANICTVMLAIAATMREAPASLAVGGTPERSP